MQTLSKDEFKNVSGGNPVVIFIAGALSSGLIYDGAKEAYRQLQNSKRSTSTGGNMQRGRR